MSFVLIKQGKLVTVVLFGTKLNVTELLRNLAKWIAQSLIQDQRSHYVLQIFANHSSFELENDSIQMTSFAMQIHKWEVKN